MCNLTKMAISLSSASTKEKFLLILDAYKKSELLNNKNYTILKCFLNAYSLCKNENDIRTVVNEYLGYILGKRILFTESEFQAFLAGFSVASKSPLLWKKNQRR